MNRRLIYRWIATGIIWVLLICITVISIRSANITQQVGKVAKNAVTVQHENTIASVRELACAFATEWATWNGDQQNYQNRMKVFLEKTPTSLTQPSNAVQQATSAAITSLEKSGEDRYRVRVLLHTKRLVSVADAQGVHPALIPITRDDAERLRSGGAQFDWDNHPAWLDGNMHVEILIDEHAGQPIIASLPVLVGEQMKGGIIKAQYKDGAPKELIVFVNQFLAMYYQGEPLQNYLTADTKVYPFKGGWQLVEVKNVTVDDDNNPQKAMVETVISGPGVENLQQVIYLEIKTTDEKSYLVKDMGTGI